MGKGAYHTTAQKHKRHYEFKRRCCIEGCKKRARVIIDNKPYCKKHYEKE